MSEICLQGTVAIITFRNEDNGYTVAKIHCHDFKNKEITVVGSFPSIDVGETGDFYGEWINDPQYGRQFKASRIDFIAPTTTAGIENLLAKGKFRGIGKKFAKRIVQKFGKDTINVIENKPDSLLEVKGISQKKLDEIVKSWNRKKTLKHILLYLSEHDIQLRYAETIYARYKTNAIKVLRENPYQLTYDIRGIGFKTADQIALAIGFEETSVERIKSALIYLLIQASEEGHTFLPAEELVQKGSEYLNLDIELLNDGIERLKAANKIIVEQDKIFLRFLFIIEENIVKRIKEICDYPYNNNKKENVLKEILEIEKSSGITYTDNQKKALNEALSQKISVITGGPGTGKTTIIKALIKLFQNRNLRIRLASPTGRAAKRMEEACGHPAQTIHRMLDFNPQSGNFNRNLRSKLDTDVVVIDEVSMIDSPLMAALLSGLDKSVRLVLVGDADQLPSVGPGNVLKDILLSDSLPVVRLDVIFRQEEASDIIVTAHKINSGVAPEINNSSSKNFFFIYEKEPSLIPGKIADLLKRRLPDKYGYDPLYDVQVLTPMYKGDTGAKNMNSLLQKVLNPVGKAIQRGDRKFVVGDKVMQVRNNYTKEVYNGDIGFIAKIDTDEGEMEILYDNRRLIYSFEELNQIVHAYAITVHKSQGSEYKAVILPLTTQHYIMLQKNLLYTAVTRAKHLMIIIGTYKAFNIAVRNNKTAERHTFLAERLRNPDKIETQLNLVDPLEESFRDWY